MQSVNESKEINPNTLSPKDLRFTAIELQNVVTTADLFELVKQKKKMEKYRVAEDGRVKYLEKVIKDEGDLHYFKRQTFSLRYKRMVLKFFDINKTLININIIEF